MTCIDVTIIKLVIKIILKFSAAKNVRVGNTLLSHLLSLEISGIFLFGKKRPEEIRKRYKVVTFLKLYHLA